MVNIVNKEPHPSVVKEIVCANCGCTLAYTPNDIKHGFTHDYTGSQDSVRFIKCPNCESKVVL